MKGKKTIQAVIADHGITAEQFFGKSRVSPLVEARSDAAHRLKDLGFSVCQIGRLLKLDHSSVSYYLNPRIRDRKQAYYAAKGPLTWLDEEARKVVRQYASAEGVPPRTIIAEWVRERAEHEASAKARAA